jgi:nicotinamide phosphoribosyltransferase
MRSLILSTDSYKHSHYQQYPAGAKFVSSYIEARRGSERKQVTQFFGLQAFILEYLSQPFHSDDIAEAKELLELHPGRSRRVFADRDPGAPGRHDRSARRADGSG